MVSSNSSKSSLERCCESTVASSRAAAEPALPPTVSRASVDDVFNRGDVEEAVEVGEAEETVEEAVVNLVIGRQDSELQ